MADKLFHHHNKEADNSPPDYEREEKEHKHHEHLGEVGAVGAGAFALVINVMPIYTCCI